MPNEQKPFFLSRHVHICLTEDGAVFLDLEKDRYVGMSGSHLEVAESRIAGWPRQGLRSDPPSFTEEFATSVLAELCKEGLLTHEEQCGREVSPPRIVLPDTSLIDGEASSSTRLFVADTVRFLAAFVKISLALRFRTLRAVLDRFQSRKPERAAEFDFALARRLVRTHGRLRPFVYSAAQHCLLDTLVIAEFFARYRLFPKVVFAVTTQPFRAHCWLQQDTVTINDEPHYVSEFTPILVL